MSQTYREGELVWAKMRGHPHWPAKVARCPKGQPRAPGKFWIFFFGTHEHAWLPAADLCSYEENRERFSLPKKVRGFAEAIWEVEEDPDLVITLGKPPSKRRRRSVQPGRSGQSQEIATEAVQKQVTTVVPEKLATSSPKSLPPLSCCSSQQPETDRPRYITRRQKRSSEGFVAEITQNFAARMELKSPQLRPLPDDETSTGLHSSQTSQKKEGSNGERTGHCESVEVAESDVQFAGDHGVHSKQRDSKSNRKTRSTGHLLCVAAPCSESSELAVKSEGEETRDEVGKDDEQKEGEKEVNADGDENEGTRVLEREIDSEKMNNEIGKKVDTETEIEREAVTVTEVDNETDMEGKTETQRDMEADKGVKVKELEGEGEREMEADKVLEVESEKEKAGEGMETVDGAETEEVVDVASVPEATGESTVVADTGGASSCQSTGAPLPTEGNPTNKENKSDIPRFSVHKDMPSTEVLMVLNYNLKASLALQAKDVSAAMATLQQLQCVKLTAKDLQQVPDVVATLRKVRRFSGDESVRGLAEEVYSSMKALFQTPGSETTPPHRGVQRKMMVAKGGRGGKAPSTRSAGSRKTRSNAKVAEEKPVQVDLQQQHGSEDQTVPSLSEV